MNSNIRYRAVTVSAAAQALLYALAFTIVAGPCSAQEPPSAAQHAWGRVRFESSDQRLVAGFNWAKQQALAYVFTGDPVGDWYEAALPGRSAFCMRDVSHQSIGAQVLGLAAFNRNMLHKFAASIAESRGWCGYWEINKFDQPAPVDYRNDQDFWFNLPANFDVVNTCYEAYQWTGDTSYLNDPVFLNFYQRTFNDYIRHWDKDGKGVPESFPEYGHRGLGSYDENPNLHIKIGGDLVAAEYAAYLAYASIADLRHDPAEAASLRAKAAALRQWFNDDWWDARWQVFNSALLSNDKMYFESSTSSLSLWFGLVLPGDKLQHELDLVVHLASPGAFFQERRDERDAHELEAELAPRLPMPGVEEMSYLPEIAYRYGEDARGYVLLLALMDPGLQRREYPEVSYSVIRTVAVGVMGMDPDAAKRTVKTLSHLTGETAWATLENVPVFNNQVAISHAGLTASTFINQSGPAIDWKATFRGSFHTLVVDGKAMPAQPEQGGDGNPESFVVVSVEPGRKITVGTKAGPAGHGAPAAVGGAMDTVESETARVFAHR